MILLVDRISGASGQYIYIYIYIYLHTIYINIQEPGPPNYQNMPMGLWGPDPGPAPKKPTRNDPPSFLGPGPGWGPWGHGPGPTLILWANIFGCVCLPMVICLFFCVWQCMFLHSESPIGKCFCFWGGAATGMVHGIGGRVGPPRGPLGGLGTIGCMPCGQFIILFQC